MSEENVELVRRGIANVDEFWAMLDEYVVWDLREFSERGVDLDPVYVGRDAVIDASRRYWGTWKDYSLEAEELIDAGASVVVAVRERMRGKGSGVEVLRRFAQIWTFSRGQVIRWEIFDDRVEALAAVEPERKTRTPRR